MNPTSCNVVIIWHNGPVAGKIEVHYGTPEKLRIGLGKGQVAGTRFRISSSGPCRLDIRCRNANLNPGSCAARLTVHTPRRPFTFFLRDVNADWPIFIPEYGVIVTKGSDQRSYADIATDMRGRGQLSELERIERDQEETYEQACRGTRVQIAPTWLGLSRDMRIFSVGFDTKKGYWGYVIPRDAGRYVTVPESEGKPIAVAFTVGRGAGCRSTITRRLEEGVLPILHSTQWDGKIRYDLTAFATLETSPIAIKTLRGSNWLAAYCRSGGNMATPEEQGMMIDRLEESEMSRCEEETVCCLRVTAANTGVTPRYAWFQAAYLIHPEDVPALDAPRRAGLFESGVGFSRFESGRIFAVNRLNAAPMPDAEMAILLQPGQTVVLEMLIPHRPLPRKRALALARLDVDRHLKACRDFWSAKLASAAQVALPETAIDERVKAGLLHCDLVVFGLEPHGTVAPCTGVYGPIGSESAPIIQFFDSMGWHKLAERALDFFLERQRPDGFMQNFAGYELETGPVLWTMGEHYRYTRDDRWVRHVKPGLLKACDYLLRWRNRNKRDELRGSGYGLLDGKVADPQDRFHSFMLNALSHVGLQRAAEMQRRVDPSQSRWLAREAAAFRRDIRTAYFQALARSPAIPRGNGAWAPSFPPWSEYPGPVSLYAEGGRWFTHGAFGVRDSLIGALYLVLGEVLSPRETAATILLDTHQELFTSDNSGFSQPYYCRHDDIHLRRGDVKAFLKTYYTQLAALQDRETYTFWEHISEATPHKTHEEGWFLMQTRWMLYREDGEMLTLLAGIPRAWLASGRRIEFRDMASYFGPISLRVESSPDQGVIFADYRLDPRRRPRRLRVRLPHPEERRAKAAIGGRYLKQLETVEVINPGTTGHIEVRFDT